MTKNDTWGAEDEAKLAEMKRAYHAAEEAKKPHTHCATCNFKLRRAYSRPMYCTPACKRGAGTDKPRDLSPSACKRCSGIGRLDAYRHINGGVCFSCEGSGKNS